MDSVLLGILVVGLSSLATSTVPTSYTDARGDRKA